MTQKTSLGDATDETAEAAADRPARPDAARGYVLEEQVGHLLRRAHQRATAIFMAGIAEYQLTPTQFAALAKIFDEGVVSQNRLGRLTAMDPATMQGVIGRLLNRGLVRRDPDPGDRRRRMLRLTAEGERTLRACIPRGRAITRDTLAPLTPAERKTFLRLLGKLS